MKPAVGRVFALGAGLILLVSSIYWALLGARIHAGNADQLVDGYMFESATVFQQAVFPATHSFLLKWPLFWVMGQLGNTPSVYEAATVGLVAVTVGGFAYVLWRMTRRYDIFGLLCLALSSCLLMVPAQPNPGDLLPVNMAMLTTRNIEYLMLLLAVWLLLKTGRWMALRLGAGVMVIGLLVASDKLFAPLLLAGGIAYVAWQMFQRRRWRPPAEGSRFLAAAVAGIVLSVIILWLIQRSGLTGLAQQATATPYPLVASFKQLFEAVCYAITGLLTIFGANPSPGESVLRDLPIMFWQGIWGLRGIPVLVNIAVLGMAGYAVYRLVRSRATGLAQRSTLLMIGFSLAALAVFIGTDHYYPADARYLGVSLFAGFMALALVLRRRRLSPRTVAVITVALCLSIGCGLAVAQREYRTVQQVSTADMQLQRDVLVNLKANHLNAVAGDYWQVMPLKTLADGNLTVWPLSPCAQTAISLTSKAWKPAAGRPVAYVSGLPTAGGASAGYGSCRIAQAIGVFGQPDRRIPVSTKQGKRAVILVYDKGFNPAPARQIKPVSGTVQSAAATQSRPECTAGTAVNVVAHEDDDTLFMNPDIRDDIANGICQHTIYLTAGNAGAGPDYWLGREDGARDAYGSLYGTTAKWQTTYETLQGGLVTTSRLEGSQQVALTFVRLPDGNLRGDGFKATNNQSLRRLHEQRIPYLTSLDGRSKYSRSQLVAALTDILRADNPRLVRAQGYEPGHGSDHDDHIVSGILTSEAFKRAAPNLPEGAMLQSYAGYSVKSLPSNLGIDDTAFKTRLFLTYAKSDKAVCQSETECYEHSMYGAFFSRQYEDRQR